jgi:hypothetical protein
MEDHDEFNHCVKIACDFYAKNTPEPGVDALGIAGIIRQQREPLLIRIAKLHDIITSLKGDIRKLDADLSAIEKDRNRLRAQLAQETHAATVELGPKTLLAILMSGSAAAYGDNALTSREVASACANDARAMINQIDDICKSAKEE